MDKNITTTPLNGISQKIGNTSIKEVVFGIFCISIPKNMERNSIKELKKILKINPPKIGKSTLNNEGSMRLIKNSVDQYFILFSNSFKNMPFGECTNGFLMTVPNNQLFKELVGFILNNINPRDYGHYVKHIYHSLNNPKPFQQFSLFPYLLF